MNKSARIFAAAFALSIGGVAATHATVTLQLAGGYLKDQSTTNVPYGSGTLLLVASTGDTSFTAPSTASTLTVGSAISPGSDDVVLFKSTISGDGNQNGVQNAGEVRQLSGALTLGTAASGTVAAGDPIIMYWFPTVSSTATSLASGTDYGVYRSTVANGSTDADTSSAWYIPANGSSAYNLLFLTSDAGSAINTSTSGIAFGQAVDTVVPEPSTTVGSLLFLVAGTGIYLRRMRSERKACGA